MKTLQQLLCLVAVIQFPGVFSQITMLESGPGTVKPTETLELTCKVSGASLTDSTNIYGVSWFRQSENKQMEWLVDYFYNGNSRHIPFLEGRLTLSRDINKGEVFFKITGMRTEDSAKYYCVRYGLSLLGGWSGYFDKWGQGTDVLVTSATASPPSLFALISCGTSQGNEKTAIGCLATGFIPNSVEYSWKDKSNNSISVDLRNYNSVLQSGGTYVGSTQADVQSNSWNNGDPYYCSAKHPQGTVSAVVQLKRVTVPKKPIVTLHAPLNQDIIENGNGSIVCIAHGFNPVPIKMEWMENFENIVDVKEVTEEVVSDGNGGFTQTSYITVSQKKWDTDTVYSCIVKHPASDFNEMKNVSKSILCDSHPPAGVIQVNVRPPSFEQIFLQNNAPLTCIISNMESKDGLEVTWYSGTDALPTEIEDPVYDSSMRRYTAKAIAMVCPEDWKTKKFECRVSHPELPRIEVKSLSKPNGLETRTPSVYLFAPHPEEVAKKESLTLTCLVKGYFPNDLFVKWISSDNTELTTFKNTQPEEEITSSSKKSFFLYSTLTLPSVEDWNNGKAYTCIVGHESLSLHTTQRTIDKNSGKPSNVNVTLHMSDTC